MDNASGIAVVGSYGVALTYSVNAIPRPGQTVLASRFSTNHGGKGSNQAVAAARLGGDVRFLTIVGSDPHGEQGVALWEEESVKADVIRAADLPTMNGAVTVDADARNAIVVAPGALAALTPTHVEEWLDRLTSAAVCLVQLEIPTETAVAALRHARMAGVITVLNPAPWVPLPREAFAYVDYLVPNEDEAGGLLGRPYNRDGAVGEIDSLANRAVVVTEGADGATVFRDGGATNVAAPRVDAVDTTGAGDTFSAALAVALAEGAEIVEAAGFACRAAAVAVTAPGVIDALPHRSQIDDPKNWEGTA